MTKPATLDAVWDGAILSPFPPHASVFGISATGTINRTEFGVASYALAVGEMVELRIEAEFDKK